MKGNEGRWYARFSVDWDSPDGGTRRPVHEPVVECTDESDYNQSSVKFNLRENDSQFRDLDGHEGWRSCCHLLAVDPDGGLGGGSR